MSLLPQMRSDAHMVVKDDFGQDIIFTNAGNIFVVKGLFKRTGFTFSKGGNVVEGIVGDGSWIAVMLEDFNNVIPQVGWDISCADSTGVFYEYKAVTVMADRARGIINIMLQLRK
jgi:hypothetical protein